ncbi:MAG TPA: stage II sporulation protein M [Pirellulales bacterium]|jgi:uncharacterized membrane protein SpoIIM required for sporulation|nr:stage II sporulation protein M [Pirellulales bacterium]
MTMPNGLQARQLQWSELETAARRLEGGGRKVPLREMLRFAALYRAACADLALADARQLSPTTVAYLHQLVGRAHNQLYRSQSFRPATWLAELFVVVPRRLYRDNCLRLAMAIFWSVFLVVLVTAYCSPTFAEQLIGKDQMQMYERMYADPIDGKHDESRAGMAGFYVQHNAGIGLQCFGAGLLLGIGGLFLTISNAALLGSVFGFMLTTPERTNFYHFVTAHGPFELTAIVLAAGAGMRLGFSLIDTRGYTRGESLRRAAGESVAPVCAAVVLFCLAATIEAFVSPSSLPYSAKAGVAIVSAAMLLFYFFGLGRRGEVISAK